MKIRTTDDAHRESKPIKMDGILYKLRTTDLTDFLKEYFVFEIYIYFFNYTEYFKSLRHFV